MIGDYFLAGPAALFASMYFSPNAAKKRLMKHLRSKDRKRALEGVRNAAWDMTHLSDLSRRMKQAGDGPNRYVFATGDRGLAETARLIPLDADEDQLHDVFARQMSGWWPQRSVEVLVGRFAQAISIASSRSAPVGPEGDDDPIGTFIAAGERKLRDWSPPDL